MAEAARPVFGNVGLWLTVGFAILATVSGIIASVFAVSRMLAMLTNMKLVPHKHFGMPGSIQKHTLVYTVVLAALLTVFFDLGSIATLGAIFYLMIDIVIHWGVFKHLRRELGANSTVLWSAIILDAIVLGALLWVKIQNDMTVIWTASIGLGLIIAGERIFLSRGHDVDSDETSQHHSAG